jgi:hypothetical protein
MNKDNATWWAPEGFSQANLPVEYANMGDGDWYELLQKAGYEEVAEYGDDLTSAGKITVYRQESNGHLLVTTETVLGWQSQFFLTDQNRQVFFATWYPDYIAKAAAANKADELGKLTLAAISWIRHGRGIETIDEHGEHNFESLQRIEKGMRELRRKRAEKAAGEGSL